MNMHTPLADGRRDSIRAIVRARPAGLVLLLVLLVIGLLPWCDVSAAAAAGGGAAEAAGGSKQLFQWRPFLAPFHSVVLHFPIGFVTMAAILELYRVWRPSEDLKGVSVLVLWLSLVTGIIAALFGTMRAGTGGYEAKMLEQHRIYGLAVPVLTLASMVAQAFAFRAMARRGTVYAYRGVLSLTMVLLLVAGHLGGNLTHGSNYLTEYAPAFVRDLLAEDLEVDLPPETGGTNLSPGLRLYVEKVRPVLEAKCVRCHGPEKNKGEYRVDQPESALKGGESGHAAIKPGAPLESHLVRLILLPRDDDNAMPPAGKEPLTAEETMAVIHWIQLGAPFPGHPSGATGGGGAVTTNVPGATSASAETNRSAAGSAPSGAR